MKIESSFQPLNFWAQGPWMFFNIGLKFIQTWQNECFARLHLMPSSVQPFADAAAVAGIAAGQGRATPMFGCMQNAIVVGGPAEEKLVQAAPVAAKAAPVAKAAPAKVVAPAPVVEAVEAVVAEDAPLAESSASSVTSMLAMQAKSLAKAVKTTPPPVVANKSAKKPAAKAEAPVVTVAAKPVAKAAAKVVAKVATAAVKPAAKAAAATKAAPAASKKA